MVSLADVHESNSLIPTALPAGLVAIFVGGTSGIGEISAKTLANYAVRPRIYIVGRSEDAANRILAECKTINPDGDFTFMKADVSLIRNVDEVCNKIKAKEGHLNLLFLTTGVLSLDKAGIIRCVNFTSGSSVIT
jgi:NADP-dependent 3-hydroxy acid dehydrogenase YdfG